MMRVGVACFASIGGSNTVACALARHLAAAGHGATLMAPAPPAGWRTADGVGFHAVPAAGAPSRPGAVAEIERLAGAIAAVTVAERLDVIHAHYALPHAVAAVRARDMLPPGEAPAVVTTLHGTDVTLLGDDAGSAALIGAALRASDAVSAVSGFLADAARARYAIARPAVIPNFIASRRRPRRRESVAAPGRDRVLLHVSTLRPVKRSPDCVAILARVVRHVPCRLWIVGDGPEAALVRREADRLGVAERVCLHGERDDVGDFLDRADLLLLPSAAEAFGMAALEAMAAGVPVVGSRVGGLGEVATLGVCARLLPVGDVDGMAAAACDLLLDPRLAAAYAVAGRRLARRRFAPADAVAAYLDCYAGAVRGRRRRGPA